MELFSTFFNFWHGLVRKKVEEMVESIVMDIVEEVWKEDQDGGRKVYEEDVEEVLQDTDEEDSPGWG